MLFAAALLTTLGILNVIDGIAAVGDSQFFVRHAHYVIGDLGSWGWALIVVGAGQGLTGLAVSRRSARQLGGDRIRAGQRAQPADDHAGLSLLVDGDLHRVDLLVVYALVVYGGPRLQLA